MYIFQIQHDTVIGAPKYSHVTVDKYDNLVKASFHW